MKGDVFKVATNILAAEIEEGKLYEFVKDAQTAGHYNKDRKADPNQWKIYAGSLNWLTKFDYDETKGVLIDVHEYTHYYGIVPSSKYWVDKATKAASKQAGSKTNEPESTEALVVAVEPAEEPPKPPKRKPVTTKTMAKPE